MAIVIFILAVLICVCICLWILVFLESKANIQKEVAEFVVTEMYMNGDINVDTYLGYTLPASEKAQGIISKDRFEKFKRNEIYSDGILSSKIDRDINIK